MGFGPLALLRTALRSKSVHQHERSPYYRSTVHAGAGSETFVKLNCYEWGTHSIESRQRPETPRAQGGSAALILRAALKTDCFFYLFFEPT